MSRAVVILGLASERKRAADWCMTAKAGTIVEFKESKRSTDQNSRMWALLTEIARQLPWHGVKLSPDDWKLIFMDALNQEMRLVPNLNGNGFINLGRSSSRLTKAEFGDLMTLIEEFGARHDVKFHEPTVAPERRKETSNA